MSKAKFNRLSKLEKEIQELKEKQEQAKRDTFYSIGELIFKEWDLEVNDDYDLLEEFIKDKAEEFAKLSNDEYVDLNGVEEDNTENNTNEYDNNMNN